MSFKINFFRMFLLIIGLTIVPVRESWAKIATSGRMAPVSLPNGRTGSTPTAVYQMINEVTFSISAPQNVMLFATTVLYLGSCSGSSVAAARCPFTESAAGNEKLSIIEVSTNTVVGEEIFEYSLSTTSLFPSVVPETERPSIGNGAKRASTPHFVVGLTRPGTYKARLEIRNDFRPITAHSKRITVVYE